MGEAKWRRIVEQAFEAVQRRCGPLLAMPPGAGPRTSTRWPARRHLAIQGRQYRPPNDRIRLQ
jgi:hypothetical protein